MFPDFYYHFFLKVAVIIFSVRKLLTQKFMTVLISDLHDCTTRTEPHHFWHQSLEQGPPAKITINLLPYPLLNISFKIIIPYPSSTYIIRIEPKRVLYFT